MSRSDEIFMMSRFWIPFQEHNFVCPTNERFPDVASKNEFWDSSIFLFDARRIWRAVVAKTFATDIRIWILTQSSIYTNFPTASRSCFLPPIINSDLIEDKTGSKFNLAFLFFPDPPVIREPPRDQIVRAGGIAAFLCVATGDPTPHITWRKNGNKISQSTSR